MNANWALNLGKIYKFQFAKIGFQTRNAKVATVEGLLPYSGVESSDLKQYGLVTLQTPTEPTSYHSKKRIKIVGS